ncbi:MAG: helix-turn-helix domain-containing protein [Fulvivirga sp.]|uniref:helix-turn-helix domain-containing protein n=1 Tax=Fulvivirga sp. TaxID=1931237 RepID=UPI0032EBAC5F
MLEALIFVGVPHSLLLIATIVYNKPISKPNKFLIGWFVVCIYHLTFYRLGLDGKCIGNVWQSLGAAMPIFHMVIIYLYVNALHKTVAKNKLLYSGAICLGYWMILIILNFLDIIKVDVIAILPGSNSNILALVVAPSFLLVFLIFVLLIVRDVKELGLHLQSIYSDRKKISTRWLTYWVASFLVISIVIIVGILLSDLGIWPLRSAVKLVCFLLSMQIFFIGIVGIGNGYLLNNTPESIRYQKSGLTKDGFDSLKVRLNQYLTETKPYLNSELKVQDVAIDLNVPSYQISQVVNEGFNKTFFDLINEYRVDEFKRNLNDQSLDHLSLLGIAFESGFNSKSSFYKIFKSHTGLAPSEYKKRIKKS